MVQNLAHVLYQVGSWYSFARNLPGENGYQNSSDILPSKYYAPNS